MARLTALRHPRSRQRFLAGRVLLRRLLARALDTDPGRIPLRLATGGKPFVADSPLAFNLSHSGPWLALAIAPSGTLGIDIENPRKTRNLLAIARHYFHPDETQHLQNLPDTARHQAFYRYWTLKEAFFKARGTGIAEGLGKVLISPDDPITLTADPDLGDDKDWQLYYWQNPLALGPECHLALVQSTGGEGVELIPWRE